MYNANIPDERGLPSTAKLVKSTIFAAITATILLITVVMPAEYGLDPTGLGRITGLQKMGEIKMTLAQEAAAEQSAKERALAGTPETCAITPGIQKMVEAAPAFSAANAGAAEAALQCMRRDEMTFTLAPKEGNEIKVDLKKGEVVTFVWLSDAGKVNFDTHGDSKALKIKYHGYGKGSSTREEGTIKAAFDGSHGWYWRNRSSEPSTITLRTEGPYTNIWHEK